jgi:hypothetical protein
MSKQKFPSRKRLVRNDLRKNPLVPLLVILGGIVLLLGGAYAIWEARQVSTDGVPVEVSGAPSLKVDREIVDLGDVPMNKMVEVTFRISNVGDETLRFTGQPYIEVLEGC